MANVSYDTLTITINADSKQANSSIKTLSNNLRKLNNTAQEIDKEKVEEMKNLLVDIASIDFSNVSKGLQDIVSAFKSFNSKSFMSATSNGKSLSGAYASKQDMFDWAKNTQLSQLGLDIKPVESDFKNLLNISNELEKSAIKVAPAWANTLSIMNSSSDVAVGRFEKLGQELDSIGLNAKQMEIVFSAMDNQIGTLSTAQLKELEKVLQQAGMNAKDIEKTLKKLGKEGDKGGKQASGGMKQLALQFKNILKYRVVRKVIQSIFAEISNAMSELANVDSGFDQALGEIKSAFSYIGRVLVSVIAPIVKVIAPIITAIAEGIGSVVSSLGSTLAGALGQEEFAEAQENVESYTESLNKAKSVQTGFDKLNVISQDKNEGNFEMKQTEATNNLGATLQKVIEAIQPVFNALKSFIQKIKPLLNVIIDIIGQILTETMNDVFVSIASFIEAIGSILELVGLFLQVLQPVLQPIITILNQGLNGINSLITTISWLIIEILQPLMPLLYLIAQLLNLIAPLLQGIAELTKALTGNSENTGARVVAGILTGGLSELVRWIKGSFATGGFPQEDGIFFANHNELVGKFDNGRTAVANNQQITQGIYQAVLQAMRDSGGNNVVIQVDGREIANVVNKQNANVGSRFLMGGNINYGK